MSSPAGNGVLLGTCCCRGEELQPYGTWNVVEVVNARPGTIYPATHTLDPREPEWDPFGADYTSAEFQTLLTAMLDALDALPFDPWPVPYGGHHLYAYYRIMADSGPPYYPKTGPGAAIRYVQGGAYGYQHLGDVMMASWVNATLPCYAWYQEYSRVTSVWKCRYRPPKGTTSVTLRETFTCLNVPGVGYSNRLTPRQVVGGYVTLTPRDLWPSGTMPYWVQVPGDLPCFPNAQIHQEEYSTLINW